MVFKLGFKVFLQKKTLKNSKVQILVFLVFKIKKNFQIKILDSQSQQKIVAFQSN